MIAPLELPGWPQSTLPQSTDQLPSCEERFGLSESVVLTELVTKHRFPLVALQYFLDVPSQQGLQQSLQELQLPVFELPGPALPPERRRRPRSTKRRATWWKAPTRIRRTGAPAKPLSPAMRELFSRRTDPAVGDEIALRNFGLIHRHLNRSTFQTVHLKRADLEQYAFMALRHAVNGWDPTRGIAFSTYASSAIRYQVTTAINDFERLVRVSRGFLPSMMTVIRRAEDRHFAQFGEYPSAEQLCQMTGLSWSQVRLCQLWGGSHWVPLAESTDETDTNPQGGRVDYAFHCGTPAKEEWEASQLIQLLYQQTQRQHRAVLRAMHGSTLYQQVVMCRNVGLCSLEPTAIRALGAETGVSHNAIFLAKSRCLQRIRSHIAVPTGELERLGNILRALEHYRQDLALAECVAD